MRKIALLLLLIALSIFSYAQTKTISGKVVDEKGNPFANVSIVVKETSRGTITDMDGGFTINATANDILVISSIGTETTEIKVGDRTFIEVTLKTKDAITDEVIVTGYSRIKRSQYAGAVTTLSAKIVQEVPVGSFDQALQGRIPGVLVNSGSGQPGSSPNIVIRGVKSITGAFAQPLYVIDGVPASAQEFQSINPNDFESIDVLKDATSTGLYGARGANGVIVITTKRGKSGKSKITVNSQIGNTSPPDFSRLNLMNTAEILEYERKLGMMGLAVGGPGWVYSKDNPAYISASATQQAAYDKSLDSVRNINTDLGKLFFRNGFSQSHNVSLSGGNDNTRFFLSAGYFAQEGVDKGSDLKRYTNRFNIDHKTGRLSVQFNTAIGYSITQYSEGEALGNSARDPFQMIYRARPYENPYNADGTLNYGVSTPLSLKTVANLLEGIQNSSLSQKQLKMNSGLTLSFQILPYLTARNVTGIDYSNNLWQRYIVPGSYVGSIQTYGASYPGLDIEAYLNSAQLINTSSLLFAKKFNLHDIEAGAYFEGIRTYNKGMGFTLFNLDPRLLYTGQGAGTIPTNGAANLGQNATSAKSQYGIRSYFGTFRYTYNSKYTLNANIRKDGTSRIANVANREITTWSTGFTWNAIDESFIKNQGIFSDLKLRASYGIVPNIGSITTSSYGMLGTAAGTWVSVPNYQGPQVPSFGTTTYPGSTITGIAPTTPGNPNLKIEHINEFDLGIDLAFWKSRASVSVDYYNNKTVDLFVSQPLSATTGFGNTTTPINAGIMRNKGFEFLAKLGIVRTSDLQIDLHLNHAINTNKIEDLGLVNEYVTGTFLIKEGLPYGSHYTYHYLGADPASGKPVYEKLDGSITNDISQAGQFANFGTYVPKNTGGFGADIAYKGFSIQTLFSYQYKVVRSNNTRNWITRGTLGYQGGTVNGSRELLTDQWMQPGDVKFYQSPLYDRQFTSSDLQDAKFLKFRSLAVSYNLPASVFSRTNAIKGVRVYMQGFNLFTWSPWQGVDPEDSNNISLNEYPNPRMVVGGIEISL
jgi:TonB-linked SusC/RagA family outer membrane protein